MKNGTHRVDTSTLSGCTVLVTRPVERSAELVRQLGAAGARVVALPTIRIVDPPDPEPLLDVARRIDRYDWVVFTSANGVQRLLSALETIGAGPDALVPLRRAAIGPATQAVLAEAGIAPEVVPESYRAEGLVDALVPDGASGASSPLGGVRFLLPRAAGARQLLPEALRAAGADVDEVTAYVAVPETSSADRLRRLITGHALDWITFTSSSTVRSYVELAGHDTGGARVAAIGPITSATAQDLGIHVDVVATRYTSEGLVRALKDAS